MNCYADGRVTTIGRGRKRGGNCFCRIIGSPYCRRERERFIELPLLPRLIFDMTRPVDIRFEFLARGAFRLVAVLRPTFFFERDPLLSPRAAVCRYDRVAFSTERELLAFRFEDCSRAFAVRFGLIERRALRLVFCSCIVALVNLGAEFASA